MVLFFSFLYLIHCFLHLPSSPPPPLQPLIWCFDSPFISATWNGKSQPWVNVHRIAGQLLDSCEHSSARLTQELDQTCLWSSFDAWICTDCTRGWICTDCTRVDVSTDQGFMNVHRTAGQLLDSCEHSSARLTQELDQTCLWSSFDAWICTDCTHVDVSADQGFMDPFCSFWRALVWDLNFLCLCWLETAFCTVEAHGVHLICLNCLRQNWFALSVHWLKLCHEMLQICDWIKMYIVSVS